MTSFSFFVFLMVSYLCVHSLSFLICSLKPINKATWSDIHIVYSAQSPNAMGLLAHPVECERWFSIMTIIKTDRVNKLSTDTVLSLKAHSTHLLSYITGTKWHRKRCPFHFAYGMDDQNKDDGEEEPAVKFVDDDDELSELKEDALNGNVMFTRIICGILNKFRSADQYLESNFGEYCRSYTGSHWKS